MKSVIIVAPEFPPANTAAVQRSRIFSTYLPRFGWRPLVLTVQEDQIEGPLDRDLERLLPGDMQIIRTGAIPIRPWRFIGDMGLRSLWHHKRAIQRLCKQFRVDLVFIPGPPWFTFLLGPWCLKRFGIPYVIDYIDPWISRWSAQAPFLSKEWAHHRLARFYEKKVLRNAAHVTAVSQGIHDELERRYSFISGKKSHAIPYGGDLNDFQVVRDLKIFPPDFTPGDGQFHICFTGAMQPTGFEILRTFFSAMNLLKEKNSQLFSRVRLHFYGTSNLSWGCGRYQIIPIAQKFNLQDHLTEIPERIPYLQSLSVQASASVNLIMGSSERYYHASKLYSCLLAGPPVLAICHEEASILKVLRGLGIASFISFPHVNSLPSKVENLYYELLNLIIGRTKLPAIASDQFRPYSAVAVTKILAQVFDQVVEEK